MKTSNMITVLKCGARQDFLYSKSCQTCPAKEECKVLCDPFTTKGEEAIAERLEQLLINLRTTKKQNGKLVSDVTFWKHRYETLLKEVTKIVHQQEILNKISSQGE